MSALLFSVFVMLVVFLRSWFVALRDSQTNCSQNRVCDTISIFYDLMVAVLSGWMLMFGIIFFMWFVEIVVVGIILKPLGPKKRPKSMLKKLLNFATSKSAGGALTLSLGMRVVVAWMMDWRLWASIVFAIMSSAMFAFVVLAIIGWHADDLMLPEKERNMLNQRGVVAIYIFQLFAVFSFVIYQLWIGASTAPVRSCR